jgi:ribosome-associated translation inhibitor RaiA
MAQLVMKHDIVDNPQLRQHVADNVAEIQDNLPTGAPLTVHIRRISKHLFGANVRVRMLGRDLVVRSYDTDLMLALAKARRHLLRQVDDLRHFHRAENRQRRPRFGGSNSIL